MMVSCPNSCSLMALGSNPKAGGNRRGSDSVICFPTGGGGVNGLPLDPPAPEPKMIFLREN